MKNTKIKTVNKTANKKDVKKIVFLTIMFLLVAIMLIIGAVLIGIGYTRYVQYNGVYQTWYQLNNGNMEGFKTYIDAFNVMANENSWTRASINQFAPGCIMMGLGGILLIIAIVITIIKSKQKNKIDSQQINNVESNQNIVGK